MEVDSLRVKIESSSTEASKGIDKLCASLSKLDKSVSSVSFNGLISNFQKLQSAVSQISSESSSTVKALTDTLGSLSKIQFKDSISTKLSQMGKSIANFQNTVSGSFAGTISDVAKAIQTFADATAPLDESRFSRMSGAISALQGLSKVKLDPSLTSNVMDVVSAMKQLAAGSEEQLVKGDTVSLALLMEDLMGALEKMRSLKDFSLPKNLGENLTNLVGALQYMNASNLSQAYYQADTIAQAMEKLSQMSKVSISASLGTNILNLASALETMGAANINTDSIGQIATAVGGLKNLSEISISANLGEKLLSVAAALEEISNSKFDTRKINQVGNALRSLGDLSNINISSTLGRNLNELSTALSNMSGTDWSKLGELKKNLGKLSNVGDMASFATSVRSLKTLPSVIEAINAADVSTFKGQIDSLVASLNQLGSVMPSLSSEATTFSQSLTTVSNTLNQTTVNANQNKKSATELRSVYKNVRDVISGLYNTLGKFITASNAYVEDLNLFTASLGEYAEAASEYADKVSQAVGINPADWLRAQGVFQTLAEGFGVASDRAVIMSQNLTQLGYDLSSFFNIDVDEAMQKLQSGLSGELEPLRRLGYDLSEARLKAIALKLGITDTYSEMSQAEKSQLRYYAIMTQVTTAQGDMARTLNSPSNQLRVLQAQLSMAAQAIGNIFIPALNAILPVCIAVVKAIRMVAQAIASLFGYSLPEVDYSGISSSVGSAASNAEDLSDNLGSAGGNASKLKKTLMSFDEINQLSDQSSGGGGGGSGGVGGVDGSAWDWELPTYDFLAGLVSNTVDAIYAKVEPVVTWIEEHIQGVADLVTAIGVGFLEWKLASALLPEALSLTNSLLSVRSVAVALASTLLGFVIQYHFEKNYQQDTPGYLLSLLASAISTGLSSLITYKSIANTFGEKAGKITASIGLLISSGISFKLMFDNIQENGLSGNAILQGIWSSIKGALAGVTIAGVLSVSPLAGGVAGIALALTAGLVVSIINSKGDLKTGWKGGLSLTADEITETAKSLCTFNMDAEIDVLSSNVTIEQEAYDDLTEKLETFQGNVNDLEVGVLPSADDQETFLTNLDGVVTAYQGYITTNNKTLALTASLVNTLTNGESENANALSGLASDLDTVMTDIGTHWGERVATAYRSGLETNFTNGETELIATLTASMTRIENAIETGKMESKRKSYLEKLMGSDSASFSEIISEFKTQASEYESELWDYFMDEKATIEGEIAGLDQAYIEAMNTDDPDLEYAAELAEKRQALLTEYYSIDWDEMLDEAMKGYTASGWEILMKKWLKSSDQEIADLILDGYGNARSGAVWGQLNLFTLSDYDSAFWADYNDDELKEFVQEGVGQVYEGILSQLPKDEQEAMMALKEAGFSDWDILGETFQTTLFKSMVDSFGGDYGKAFEVLQSLGYDMTNILNTVLNDPSLVSGVTWDGSKFITTLVNGQTFSFDTLSSSTFSALKGLGVDMSNAIADGIESGAISVTNAGDEIVLTFADGTTTTLKKNDGTIIALFKSFGIDLVEGLIIGVDGEMTEAQKELLELFGIPEEEFRIATDTNSPSGVFETLGTYIVDGLINGLQTLSTAIQGVWDTLPDWMQNMLSVILSLFAGTNFKGEGEEKAEELADGLESVDMPILKALVALGKDGWTSILKWLNLGENKGDGEVTETVGLTLGNKVSTIASWLLTNKILGGTVEKPVDVVKGTWITLPDDTTVTYSVTLRKAWAGTLTNWISTVWRKTFTVDLVKGDTFTWNGQFKQTGTAMQIKFLAGGGYVKNGEMFVANEAGAELVGRIGNKTAVANQDQIGDAIFRYMDAYGGGGSGIDEEALATAIANALAARGIGSVYINGKDMADAINAETRRLGRSAIVF